MHHELAGPLLGNIIIIAIAGFVTLACFALMLRMLLKPGETDRLHPKYRILGDDRRKEGPQ